MKIIILFCAVFFAMPVVAAEITSDATPPVIAKDKPPEVVDYYGHAMHEMHEAMTQNAPSGNADVDFVRGMIPHHQGAVDMAKIELKYGKDPELRKLAENIMKSQEPEIQQMQDWLAAHPQK